MSSYSVPPDATAKPARSAVDIKNATNEGDLPKLVSAYVTRASNQYQSGLITVGEFIGQVAEAVGAAQGAYSCILTTKLKRLESESAAMYGPQPQPQPQPQAVSS